MYEITKARKYTEEIARRIINNTKAQQWKKDHFILLLEGDGTTLKGWRRGPSCIRECCRSSGSYGFHHHFTGLDGNHCKVRHLYHFLCWPSYCIHSTDCVDEAGVPHEEGSSWAVGSCGVCTCRGGEVQCAASACPEPPCSHPATSQADCCPSCHNGQNYHHYFLSISNAIINFPPFFILTVSLTLWLALY